MLPLTHKIVFILFAIAASLMGGWGFYRLYKRVKRAADASEQRFDNLPARIGYALATSLTQERTFRNRPVISLLHSFIFYGFTYYLLVNVIDGLEGFFDFGISSNNFIGAIYNLLADILSIGVLIGVTSLLFRRLFSESKRDFTFKDKTPVHELIRANYIKRDSLIVSSFILFHVGSRIVGNAAKMVHESHINGHYDMLQPFSSAVGSVLFGSLGDQTIEAFRVFGFWGGLGSILVFLSYFPYSKHIHIFMAPLNYAFKRPVHSGVLPAMKGLEAAMESEEPRLGVEKLEELEWPRLLDAYSCIQCNRCQDVCPANATGKALSPAALEINKRMELNVIAMQHSPFSLKQSSFETGGSTAKPLLEWALNEESLWACTTCGACMQVCPVQNEQMLDIVDIRRHQVMVAGEFPQQLQTAFRGMERASNPWGISRDKRLEWAEGLNVPTIDENPTPDVIYWVGCAASYDPGAQKVARSFVQLLQKAGVNYAVLGKKEACTGDSARRAGNEFLYQQLATENVETLNMVSPKLIVATCPHCMNAIGSEYKQLGGDYKTIHHTQYLEQLVEAGKLPLAKLEDHITYHDPCYLGRHNGVFDAPRKLIASMASEVLELERSRDNSFCCGAGGAQFWKEEEEGTDRISDNRFREIQSRLDSAAQRSSEYELTGDTNKVLAVGCPFCKAMMNSTPEKQKRDDIVVKDVAEIMLESMLLASGEPASLAKEKIAAASAAEPSEEQRKQAAYERMTWTDPSQFEIIHVEDKKDDVSQVAPAEVDTIAEQPRKTWQPKKKDDIAQAVPEAPPEQPRKTWQPKKKDDVAPAESALEAETDSPRKKWQPKK